MCFGQGIHVERVGKQSETPDKYRDVYLDPAPACSLIQNHTPDRGGQEEEKEEDHQEV